MLQPTETFWGVEHLSQNSLQGGVKGETHVHWLLTLLGKGVYPCIPGFPCMSAQQAPTGTSRGSIREAWGRMWEAAAHLILRWSTVSANWVKTCAQKTSSSRGEAERIWGKAQEIHHRGLKRLLAAATWISRTIPTVSSPGPHGPAYLSVLQVTA